MKNKNFAKRTFYNDTKAKDKRQRYKKIFYPAEIIIKIFLTK